MTAFSTSFGRLHSIRKRDPKKTSVQPIDVDAAKLYHHAGPSSSSLLTPRPHHFRTTTPSPATPAASSFASSSSSSSASNSTRFVSSPTFVSSSALASANAFHAHLDALTPPLSPIQPNTAAAAHATKSPLRRALSRTFFFASANPANAPSPTPRISSPIPLAWHTNLTRAPRPARPARPATSPATGLSPNPNAFGFTASEMTRSQTSCPVIITTAQHVITTRRRSRTLVPPPTLSESHANTPIPSTSQRSASPTWSMRFSRSASPLPFSHAASSAPTAPSPISPRTSLRSIRRMHARKSIQSVFGASPPSNPSETTPQCALLSTTPTTPDPAPRVSTRPRLTRRASEESFHCRGPGFDGPPAADTRESHSLGFYTRPTIAPRSVSLYSSPTPSNPATGARRMSDFTISSYQQASKLNLQRSAPVHDILSEVEAELDMDSPLAGLGLVDSLPAAPRVMPKRLSATSQISLAESIPSSIPSSSSTVSLSSVEQQLTSSWPHLPTTHTWFSTCPPTPPSSIRLQLEFRSLPPPSPTLASKPRPLSGIFISSNSSVLDLKETIATRMRDTGYRLSPKNLTLTLHLNEDIRSDPNTALGLKLSAYGKNPAKVLDDSSRLLFEEGAQEEDLVVVDCDPSHLLWSI
ncbi:uncharacterized protein UTRI_05151_B [Ustilago trichophora]|uniref:Uncharacterized protein n=1 Tax=Ustilago trichophora TaxID=86804 RepID=A0A5C3EF14_9BASI|nr:uncharacterized protein UTRI_05151_B [Ustilago trichophora]